MSAETHELFTGYPVDRLALLPKEQQRAIIKLASVSEDFDRAAKVEKNKETVKEYDSFGARIDAAALIAIGNTAEAEKMVLELQSDFNARAEALKLTNKKVSDAYIKRAAWMNEIVKILQTKI